MKTSDIDRAFAKLGLEIRESKDKIAWFVHEGRKILMTKRSQGRGEVKGNIPHLIRQQLRLNEGQFRDLIACPLDREGYVSILKEKGILQST